MYRPVPVPGNSFDQYAGPPEPRARPAGQKQKLYSHHPGPDGPGGWPRVQLYQARVVSEIFQQGIRGGGGAFEIINSVRLLNVKITNFPSTMTITKEMHVLARHSDLSDIILPISG